MDQSDQSDQSEQTHEFNTKNLILLYNGRDEESQSNKWRFIELSIAGTLLISDEIFSVPDVDIRNKDTYIKKAIHEQSMSEYLYKENGEYGIWDCHDKCFYAYRDQEEIKEELIQFLLHHTITSYNTPYQRSQRIIFPITISSTGNIDDSDDDKSADDEGTVTDNEDANISSS